MQCKARQYKQEKEGRERKGWKVTRGLTAGKMKDARAYVCFPKSTLPSTDNGIIFCCFERVKKCEVTSYRYWTN